MQRLKNSESAVTTIQPFHSPEDIERRSFAIIDEEAGDPKPFSGPCWDVARRLVHTTADFSILKDLSIPLAAVQAGIAALRRGCTIYTDTEMVRSGIPTRRLDPLGATARCLLSLPGAADRARDRGITRSRAAVELAGESLAGSILAVGNAPTTLLALLEHLDAGGEAPFLVIGMPVGFVNAAESKALLLARPQIPAIILSGRRGGSPLAAATVNALAVLAAA